MPDLNKAISNRRKNLQKIWSSKEWKEKKAIFLKANPLCMMHRILGIAVPASLPHHPYIESYKGHYTDLELSGCVPYCNKCHFAVHHGLTLCMKCKEHYHRWDAGMCRKCFDKLHPEIVEQKKVKAEEKKALLKKLRDAEKQRYKNWIMVQKMGGTTTTVKMLTYKEWKAKKIAEGTWEERNSGGWT